MDEFSHDEEVVNADIVDGEQHDDGFDDELAGDSEPSSELVPATENAPARAGAQDAQARILKASEELARANAQAKEALAELQLQERSQSTELEVAHGDRVQSTKSRMVGMRAEVMKRQQAVERASEKLRSELERQMRQAELILAPLQEAVDFLTQALESVGLYLGKDEQIVMLRDGTSAPVNTPIGLRQLLLFMDEECAIAAEDGGITPVQIERFDEWLLKDPAHLDQVLPETKGIVAFRPRRHAPRGGWRGREADLNQMTYWLIRNGERLYRTITTLEVEDRILPYADEWEKLFTRKRRGRRVSLDPGSYEWERAQEAAQERERTYMRVGLVLEGLLHRTPIFHPLPEDGISFLDLHDVKAGKIRYITDAEALLTEGRETFEQWRRRLSEELRVGMRIVLGPGLSDHNYDSGQRNKRLHPSGANHPGPGEVFTIDEKKGSTMVFRYREGKRWVSTGGWYGGENREPKRRATCTIHPKDEFVLPFDLATAEEMERFLTQREDRQHYVEMWPILKAAIAAKHKEAAEEAPFLTMLSGVLARENGVSVADAERAAPELVWWWKLKNRYHRPLRASLHQDAPVDRNAADPDHEAKAVRMIVAEHKRRLKDERRSADPEIVSKLSSEHPHALLIARPRRGGYLVVDAAEPAKDVWVHETEYTAKGELKTRREWVLPGSARSKSWQVVSSSERWGRWDLAADEMEHLRGPEREALIERAVARMSGRRLLALAFDDDRRLIAWRLLKDADFDEQHLLTGEFRPPQLERYEGGWRRARGAVQMTGFSHGHEEWARDEERLPWEQLEWISSLNRDDVPDEERKPAHNVVWRNAKELAELAQKLGVYDQVNSRRQELDDRVDALVDSVREGWEQRAWAAERARFDEEFGDPELWEGHRKSKEHEIRFGFHIGRDLSTERANTLYYALAAMVEAGEDPAGMTVAQVLEEASERYGAEQGKLHPDRWASGRKTAPIRYTAEAELHDLQVG